MNFWLKNCIIKWVDLRPKNRLWLILILHKKLKREVFVYNSINQWDLHWFNSGARRARSVDYTYWKNNSCSNPSSRKNLIIRPKWGMSNTPKPQRAAKAVCKSFYRKSIGGWCVSLYRKSDKPDLSLDGNAYRKTICKTLRKYFASNCQGLLKTLSNKITRSSQSRPVLPEVNLQDT